MPDDSDITIDAAVAAARAVALALVAGVLAGFAVSKTGSGALPLLMLLWLAGAAVIAHLETPARWTTAGAFNLAGLWTPFVVNTATGSLTEAQVQQTFSIMLVASLVAIAIAGVARVGSTTSKVTHG